MKPKSQNAGLKAPFAISRSSQKTLLEQVVAGLRRCILTGVYKPGDVLPTTRGLAEALGVSRIVTRAAVRALTEAELINPKPGVGCVVLGARGKLWRGNVLLITPGTKGDYYVNSFSDAVRAELVRNGWHVLHVSASGNDLDLLELEITHPIDLAVVFFDNPAVERRLGAADIPFVVLGDGVKPTTRGCLAVIPFRRSALSPTVARLAREAGVKSTWQVGFEPLEDLNAAFAGEGLAVRDVLVKIDPGQLMPAAAVFAAQETFDRLLSARRPKLPDLLFFTDDYVCQGAILSLMRHGVESPRDVRLLTWSNRGNGPYYGRSLSRIEMDPCGHGKALAERLVAWLSNRKPFDGFSFSPTYQPGETFQ